MQKQKDLTLKHDVEAELEWDPEIDARKIGVEIDGGVITLTGKVHSYFEKWNAEAVAKRVHGVKAIANDLTVQLATEDHRDDSDIARSALNAIEWNFAIPHNQVRIAVSKGFITLDGEVEWQYQKRAAEDAVHHLRGVLGVSNQVTVRPRFHAGDVKEKIEAALKRSAEVDSRQVIVETNEGSVTLRGKVRSWAERQDAVNAAWAAPGVKLVVDHLAISV